MSKQLVFYSWQGDNQEAKLLLQESLEAATKTCNLQLDHASRNLIGAQDIADSLLEKIDQASIFVADVSGFIKTTTEDYLSNPNVMFELGYAVATKTWENIVLIANIDACPIDRLPFDIRNRSIIPYSAKKITQFNAELPSILRKCLSKNYITWVKQEANTEFLTLWKAETSEGSVYFGSPEVVSELEFKLASERSLLLNIQFQKHQELGRIHIIDKPLIGLARLNELTMRRFLDKILDPTILDEMSVELNHKFNFKTTWTVKWPKYLGTDSRGSALLFSFTGLDMYETEPKSIQGHGRLKLSNNQVKVVIDDTVEDTTEEIPDIELLGLDQTILTDISFEIVRYRFPANSGIPDTIDNTPPEIKQMYEQMHSVMHMGNYTISRDYYRNRASIAQAIGAIGKIGFSLLNQSDTAATDVNIQLCFPVGFKLLLPDDLPWISNQKQYPAEYILTSIPERPDSWIFDKDKGPRFRLDIGKLQPGTTYTREVAVYVQCPCSGTVPVQCHILRDNGAPIDIVIDLDIVEKERIVDLQEAIMEKPPFKRECDLKILTLLSTRKKNELGLMQKE